MKAIFPDAKSLQPMPDSSSVHPNISGNINSTTNVTPDNTPLQNIPSIQNNVPVVGPTNNQKSNFSVFYFIGFMIIVVIIIITIEKLKRRG